MGLIHTPQHCTSNETENRGPSPGGINQGAHPSAGSQGSAHLWNFQLKTPLWFKMGPKFFCPPTMCVVRQLLHFQPRSFWPSCPADFSGIFAGFLIHVADQREAEYFKAIWILQDDKLFLLSNICIITTKIIFEMATRQYNFSPSQGLKSQEKMNRACFNQEISSFSSYYK